MPTRSIKKYQQEKSEKSPRLLDCFSSDRTVLGPGKPAHRLVQCTRSGQVHLSQLGITLVLVTGIACLVLGFWMISTDFEELSKLLFRNDG